MKKSDKFIEDINNRHAVVMLGGKCVILNEGLDPVFDRPDVTFSSVADFKNRYANKMVSFRRKRVSIAKAWLESPDRREFEGIIFEPGRNIDNYYNLWRGLNVKPKRGDWSLFRDHIRDVVTNGNRDYFRYLIGWMARLVKDPGGIKPGTSIVLRGRQGTGKGIYVNYFGQIFGPHFLHITNQYQVTGRFNAHLKDAVLVYIDEGFWAGDKSAEGVLKGMVTERTHMIEPKGKDAFTVRNHVNLIIASNNSWVVPAGLEERRFFVLDIPDSQMRNYGYFQAIADQMDNGGCEALLYDLLRLNISEINLREIPRTDALLDQIIMSMNSVEKFWFNLLVEGDIYVERSSAGFFDSYKRFCTEQKIKYPMINRQFGKEIRRLCPGLRKVRTGSSHSRTYFYEFPDLETCREQFETSLNMRIDWDDLTDTDDYDTEENPDEENNEDLSVT